MLEGDRGRRSRDGGRANLSAMDTSAPPSARLAGAPSASIDEPRHDAVVATDGEPIAVGRRVVPVPRIVQPGRPRPSVPGRVGAPFGRSMRELTAGFGRPEALPAGSL